MTKNRVPRGNRMHPGWLTLTWTDSDGIQHFHKTAVIAEASELRRRLKREGLEVQVGWQSVLQHHWTRPGTPEAMRRMAGAPR